MKGKWLMYLDGLLFPPICRGCGERQNIFAPSTPEVLCPVCLARFRQECEENCRACGIAHSDCRCTPPAILEAGGEVLLHLAEYRAGKANMTSRMVLRLKDCNDHRLVAFLAARLSALVLPHLLRPWEKTPSDNEVMVTYVPRRRESVRQVGHDQAAVLAKVLAKRWGIRASGVIGRAKRQGRQQKELRADERKKNASSSFVLRKHGAKSVCGKTVVLIDDVCTTGSSLSACVALLRAAGAERVVCAVIARTEK